MDTLQLNDLEIQVNHMMQMMEQLKKENRSLRHKLAGYARDKATVQASKQNAIKKVKKIINQLKEELS